MPTHAERRFLPYTQQQLYDLVADVQRYPEFLPWCTGARITSRRGNTITADLIIGFRLVRERFTSRVTLHPNERIDVEYTSGHFAVSEQSLGLRACAGWHCDRLLR